ncbi:MAG: zinc-binding dehydrogenase [Granulosicoccus sp.]
MNMAAYIHGVRDVRVGDIAPPALTQGRVLVDVLAVGICGSDLHYYKDGGIGGAVIREPFVPGHEFCGRLCGDVEELGLVRGQLVAVDPATACHQCEWCVQGYHNLCPNVIFLGAPPYNGALTHQISVPHASLFALPDGMTPDQGAMLEPLGVCVHAIDLARPRILETVTVVGCGPIGLGILQLLKLSGVGNIIAIDPQPHRTALARQLGATYTGHTPQAALEYTDGLGSHLVIEATNSPDGLLHAIKTCRIGGRLIVVGIPDGDIYSNLQASEARRRGLTLKFSRRMGNVYPRAIELVEKQQVDVDILVSHHFNLDGSPDVFRMQADEDPDFIKGVVCPHGVNAT